MSGPHAARVVFYWQSMFSSINKRELLDPVEICAVQGRIFLEEPGIRATHKIFGPTLEVLTQTSRGE